MKERKGPLTLALDAIALTNRVMGPQEALRIDTEQLDPDMSFGRESMPHKSMLTGYAGLIKKHSGNRS